MKVWRCEGVKGGRGEGVSFQCEEFRFTVFSFSLSSISYLPCLTVDKRNSHKPFNIMFPPCVSPGSYGIDGTVDSETVDTDGALAVIMDRVLLPKLPLQPFVH